MVSPSPVTFWDRLFVDVGYSTCDYFCGKRVGVSSSFATFWEQLSSWTLLVTSAFFFHGTVKRCASEFRFRRGFHKKKSRFRTFYRRRQRVVLRSRAVRARARAAARIRARPSPSSKTGSTPPCPSIPARRGIWLPSTNYQVTISLSVFFCRFYKRPSS